MAKKRAGGSKPASKTSPKRRKPSSKRRKPSSKRKTSPKRKPWRRPNPRQRTGKAAKHLTTAEKSTAKRRARRAGRHYPNLVDNMAVAAKKGRKKKGRKKRS